MILRRFLNSLRFRFHQRLRWSRPGYAERPLGNVSNLPADLQPEIRRLKDVYGISFENRLSEENTRDNYFYLDLLHSSREKWGWTPENPRVLDVGCKNFYYIDALQAFFKPRSLTGIEVDGYTIYRDGHSRKDYADYYLKPYANASYEVSDLLKHRGTYDVITCFFPFVFPETAALWSLPLSFFDPKAFFAKIESLLEKSGFLWMLNHGEEEWEEARSLLSRTGLRSLGHFAEKNALASCDTTACVSLWKAKA